MPSQLPHLLSSIVFIASLAGVVLSIPILIEKVKKYGLLDAPNQRSSHKVPTPSLGGLSFLPGIIVGALLLPFSWPLAAFISSSILISLTGAYDDLKDLKPKSKFAIQLGVAVILFISGFRVDGFQGILGINGIPIWVGFPFTIVLIVAVINAFNLADGIDGLAGGIGLVNSIIFGFIFSIHQDYDLAILSFCLAGSLAGFLNFNLSPAKIFMGDAGSLLLGLFMAGFFLKAFAYSDPAVSTIAVSMMLFPSLDMVRLFVTRMLNGTSPFKADKEHYHHLLLKTGLDHKKATNTYGFLHALLCLAGWCFSQILGVNLSFFAVVSSGIVFYALIELLFYWNMKRFETKTNFKLNQELNRNSLYKTLLQ